MSNTVRNLLLALILLQFEPTFAQRLGLLPPNVRWQQLKHDSLRIIFPQGNEQTAKRVASLMLKLASEDPIAADSRFKPISVILQPQTNISNGYVGLAPYVSEFYLEAHEDPFALGSLPWHDLLALHEYRHVQQLNAANNGLNHIAKLIFGDLVFSGLFALSVPDWYREGDAVYSESKWSLLGRGRLSTFTLPFYQKVMEGSPWSYYKVRNGSYKEYIPDHYPLGYLLVQYGNYLFGEATWDTIIRSAPKFKHLFRPFSGLVRENSGLHNREFYLDAMEYFGDAWAAQMEAEMDYPDIPLQEKDAENDYFDMTYPDVEGDGSLYTAVTTFDKPTGIYHFTGDGKRKRIFSTGYQKDTYFDYSNDRFVWTELRYDPRWIRKDRNVIVFYDQDTRKRISIHPEKGYFTPSLSARGDKIVALHEGVDGDYALQIIDPATAKVVRELPNAENLYLGYPRFTEDELSVIATARNKEGMMCLVEQDIQTGRIRYITHYSYAVLGKPELHGPWIFLTSELSGIPQVFAVDREEGVFYQVSGGRLAHFDPAWDPVTEEVVCAEYHLQGKKLVRLPGSPNKWRLKNLHDGKKELAGYSGRDLVAEPNHLNRYTIKKYSAWSNAINPHSWVVTVSDPYYGVEVRSDNILNTVSLAAGYEVNRNTKSRGPYLNAIFGMWFPQFNLGISNVSREIEFSDGEEVRAINNRFTAGVSVPLVFTPGFYKQDLLVSVNYNTGLSMLDQHVEGFSDLKFNYGTGKVSFINSSKQGYRQIEPSFAQRFDVSYSHQVSGTPISQFYAASDMSFPALRPSHFLVLHGEVLIQDVNDGSIQLRSDYIGARGFAFTEGQTQYRFGATYGFPILYPDKGIGNILYTKRIRLQPFFDYGYTNADDIPSPFMSSMGAELVFDFDFPPISVGVRYSRLLHGFTGQANQFELFIPSPRF